MKPTFMAHEKIIYSGICMKTLFPLEIVEFGAPFHFLQCHS